jgi:hypothetical protein
LEEYISFGISVGGGEHVISLDMDSLVRQIFADLFESILVKIYHRFLHYCGSEELRNPKELKRRHNSFALEIVDGDGLEVKARREGRRLTKRDATRNRRNSLRDFRTGKTINNRLA